MREFAFISRHKPTDKQIDRAREVDIHLTAVGDFDAFGGEIDVWLQYARSNGYEGVVVVHPIMALKAYQSGLSVGIFENINRALPGEVPRFEVGKFEVFTPWQG